MEKTNFGFLISLIIIVLIVFTIYNYFIVDSQMRKIESRITKQLYETRAMVLNTGLALKYFVLNPNTKVDFVELEECIKKLEF